MSTLGKTWTAAVDTPEQIQMCLNCKWPRCVDCMDRGLYTYKDKYKDKTQEEKKKVLSPLVKDVLRLYPIAKCDREIAEKLGRPTPTIISIRRRFGIPPIRSVSQEERKRISHSWLGEGA